MRSAQPCPALVALGLAAASSLAACRGDPSRDTSIATAGDTAAPGFTTEATADASNSDGLADGVLPTGILTTTLDDASTSAGDTTTTGEGTTLPPSPPLNCSDTNVAPDEECDDGEFNVEVRPGEVVPGYEVCTTNCELVNVCGDEIVQKSDEECDYGLHETTVCKGCRFESRFVFATSTRFSGALGGVSGAHDLCNEAAAAAALAWSETHRGYNPWTGKQFKAWISDGGARCPAQWLDDADEQPLRPYVLPDGTEVAPSAASLKEELLHAIDHDEFGGEIVVGNVWTNTGADGHPLGKDWDCGNWYATGEQSPCEESSKHCGAVGMIEQGAPDGSRWTYDVQGTGHIPCGFSEHLYCFEQSLYQRNRELEGLAPDCIEP